jgi:hypothetical protein
MRTEPEKFLPQLAANLHIRVVEGVMQSVFQMLPGVISQQIHGNQTASQNENEFFKGWQELRKPEYNNTLVSIAQAYAKANPKATREKFIKDVGAQAWITLGLPFDQLQAKLGAPPPAPSPAAGPKPDVIGPAGYVPAGSPVGPNGGAGVQTPAPGNKWEQLVTEWDADDEANY